MNPNYDENKNTGKLETAKYWYYNKPEQVKALSNEKLLEEWKNLTMQLRAIRGLPWSDEMFWTFGTFSKELSDRKLDSKV